jgi:hypothetical protein
MALLNQILFEVSISTNRHILQNMKITILLFEFKEIKVTEEEMYLAKIPANRRDYCGHHLIDLMKCKRENFPFLSRCEHYTHEWNNCQNEE